MLDNVFAGLDLSVVLIIGVFFLLLEYRPPWWYRPLNEIKKGVKLVPGPYALPVIGTNWFFSLSGHGLCHLHKYYEDLYAKYGPVIKEETFFNVPVINLFEKRDIEKVLRNGGKYPLRPPSEAVSMYRASRPDRYSTIGLVNEQGPAWNFLRTNLTPVLMSPRTISAFQPEVATIADDWCYLLKQVRPTHNKIVNLDVLVDRLALELTCALVLGRRMGMLIHNVDSSIALQLGEAVRQHFLATRDTYFGLPFWKYFPTPAYRKLVQCEDTIYVLATELIRTADEATKESAVFQSVLNARIDEKEKIATVVDFISAGIHTMKNSLLFLLNLVGENEEVQDRILLDSQGLYAKACLLESFRLFPTAGSLARILDTEMEVGGYRLDKGTVVVCHCGLACRDARNFADPNAFQPDRWIDERTGKLKSSTSGAFLMAPFGAGKRICPGKRFVESVLPAILLSTVKEFRIQSEPIETVFEFLLTPKGPIGMTFEDRC